MPSVTEYTPFEAFGITALFQHLDIVVRLEEHDLAVLYIVEHADRGTPYVRRDADLLPRREAEGVAERIRRVVRDPERDDLDVSDGEAALVVVLLAVAPDLALTLRDRPRGERMGVDGRVPPEYGQRGDMVGVLVSHDHPV